MAFPPLFAFFLFLLPIFSLLLISKTISKKHNLPSGPAQLPLIGNLHLLGKLPHRSLCELSKKYGPLMYLKLGTIPTMVVSSANMAKEFMKSHDIECCSRPLLTPGGKYSYDFKDIAFSPYGEQWRELRKICMLQLFSIKKVESFRSVREEEVEGMVKSITSQILNGSRVNLREESIFLSNNITFRSALGKKYYSNDPSHKGKLHDITDETLQLLGTFFVGDYIPMLGWVDVVTGLRGRLEKSFCKMDEFYEEVIEEHRDQMRKKNNHCSQDTLDALLDIQMGNEQLTDQHIKGILMNIFAAGSDTSAVIIEWAMVELMRSPQAMRKAKDEVRAKVGSKGMVEESDLGQLNYLKLVVKESLRLHPPGPLLVQREATQDFKINNGYDIPAKTRLIINAWAIARDPEVWERPEEFNPDRFIDNSINFTGHDFQFIPFGSGRRICPAMHLGVRVVELALANLLYSFNWELPKGMSKEDIDIGEASGLSVHVKSSLPLVATKYG